MALEFGVWSPVCGGWLRVEGQRTSDSLTEVLELAETADRLGYDVHYIPGHYLNAVHGPENDVADAWMVGAAAIARTRRIRSVIAVQPGFQVPGAVAKMAATLARLRPHAVGLSVLAGWWQREVESLGDAWLPHADRYRRCSEFVDVLHAFWSRRAFAHRAEYYQASSATLSGPSVESPPIFIAGESRTAIELAARAGDYLFINGGSVEQVTKLAQTAKNLARERHGRKLKIALSAFGLARRTQTEAEQRLLELVKAPARQSIEYFAGQIDPAVVAHTRGSLSEQIEANLGLNAGLVGDADRILQRLREFEAAGVDTVLVKSEPSVSEAELFSQLVIEPYRAASRVTRQAS